MLSSAQEQALKTELDTDPMALGYAAHVAAGEYGALESLINAPNPAWNATAKAVPVTSILTWALSDANPANGATPWVTISAAAVGTSAVQPLAAAFLRVTQPPFSEIDYTQPSVQSMMGTAVAAGLITQAQHDNFFKLASVSPASRAEALWGPGTVVSHIEIAEAIAS